MDASFLYGLHAAWAATHLALGVFFVVVWILGRRERDSLLFGLMCVSLAVTTLGIGWGYRVTSLESWIVAAKVGQAGAIAALVLNLHFAIRSAGRKPQRWLILGSYLAAAFFEAANLAGLWFVPGSPSFEDTRIWGVPLRLASAEPTLLALGYYVLNALALVAAQAYFVSAYRSGRREALIAFFGGLFVCGAGASDISLLSGIVDHGLYALPAAFLFYALAVATTLVLRFRRIAVELARTEGELQRAAEELRVSHAELVEMQSELVKKEQLAAVGELAAAIAHEVRNPLAVIKNAVSTLRRSHVADGDRDMLLGIVDEETGRLNRLVTDLLQFARPAKVRRESVDLLELAAFVFPAGCEQHPVEISKEPGADQHAVADPALLRSALQHLVENARQASPEGAPVQVVIARGVLGGAPCVRLEVKDAGGGMPPEVLARALDPFFTTQPSGTGLGLPVVQRIARSHGGRLELTSEVGKGTTAALLLPGPDAAPESFDGRRTGDATRGAEPA